ncbi:MAG: 1-acyl-sn-glycerol-3-phosphate acyltransferase [Acidobacteria bacterium]|nr:1-acyl-sn-glycerol-3-phosphate acyltransferase [Acidobacteriota bacterium]
MASPRFRSVDRRIRTAVGSSLLIGLGGLTLSAIGPRRQALHRAERRWGSMARRFLRLEVDASGLERIDPDEQYVVMPLHEGFVDAVLLLDLPLDLRFTVRDELFEWRHLGLYLRRTGQLVIPTGSSVSMLRHLYRQAAMTFDRGESLVIFPQGSILGIEAAFERGAFRLAERFDRPVLPIVITGTHRVWEHPYSSTLRYGQKVSLRVLEPVPGAEAARRARSIEQQMKGVALQAGMAPVRRFVPERDGWWDGYAFEIDPDYPELAAAIEARRRSR